MRSTIISQTCCPELIVFAPPAAAETAPAAVPFLFFDFDFDISWVFFFFSLQAGLLVLINLLFFSPLFCLLSPVQQELLMPALPLDTLVLL
jgi:hypothetical protein